MGTLPEFNFNYKYFLDRSTLLFGESGTGKSFVISDILYQLKPHVDQIIVIAPTDRQNNTYSKSIVPPPFIHYTLTPKLLEDIWNRQNEFVEIYTAANKPAVLQSLFRKTGDSIAIKMLQDAEKQLELYTKEIHGKSGSPATAAGKISKITADYKELRNAVWKQIINKHIAKLKSMSLSEEEKITLEYLNINPRLVLIFDDCTDLLKKYRTHPVIQKIFYQGRWAYITALIACHTDKALDPELKKNTFVTIFTEEACARAYFLRPSNDLDKDARQRANEACKIAFTPMAQFQKLAWVREEKQFYRLTAQTHGDFRFGSPHIWKYSEMIKNDPGKLSANNRFISKVL